MAVSIRYAEPDEVDVLTAIEVDADQRYAGSAHPEMAGGDHFPREALERAVAARQIFVAADGDEIVGWLLVTKVGEEACVGQISVSRAAGGRGVGTKLLTTSIDGLRRAGHRTVVLNTQADVAWNRPWYERHGFVVVPPEEWTDGMRAVTEDQRADGLDWNTRVHMRLALRHTVACGRCGLQAEVADANATPPGWTFETERGRVVRYCVECVRANIRSIEAKLPEEWWG